METNNNIKRYYEKFGARITPVNSKKEYKNNVFVCFGKFPERRNSAIEDYFEGNHREKIYIFLCTKK